MSQNRIYSLKEFDFSPYGEYYDLRQMSPQKRKDWVSYLSGDPIMKRPLRFGMTRATNGPHFLVDSMERHLSTEEIQFAGDSPIILSICDSDPMQPPKADRVISFRLEPGEVIVLKRGIWHDACHAVNGYAQYYFLSYSAPDPDETRWRPVEPEPLEYDL